jgi:hypothetical protein
MDDLATLRHVGGLVVVLFCIMFFLILISKPDCLNSNV